MALSHCQDLCSFETLHKSKVAMITAVEREICYPIANYPGFEEKNVGIIFNNYAPVFKAIHLFKSLYKIICF